MNSNPAENKIKGRKGSKPNIIIKNVNPAIKSIAPNTLTIIQIPEMLALIRFAY